MPPKNYPSWADAMEDGYTISAREKGELIDLIEHVADMVHDIKKEI